MLSPDDSGATGYVPPSTVPTISEAAPLARAAAIASAVAAPPVTLSLRSAFDQAELPCCVSCALAGAMEVLHPDWPPLAPLFHYHVTRDDNHGADASGFLRLDAAIRTLTNQGICERALHDEPYTLAGADRKPSPAAYADGRKRRIERQGLLFRYRSLVGASRAAAIREQIRKKAPVVIGLSLPEGYPTSFLDGKREWTDPEDPSPSGTHHCVLVAGYNDARAALRIQDSRGRKPYFDGAGWWMGYRVADSPVVKEAFSLY